MSLLAPETEKEDLIMRNALSAVRNTPDSIHMGASTMGYGKTWYAVSNGKVFNYEFEWEKTENHRSEEQNDEGHNCLHLKKNRYSKSYSYSDVSCIDSPSYYICIKAASKK